MARDALRSHGQCAPAWIPTGRTAARPSQWRLCCWRARRWKASKFRQVTTRSTNSCGGMGKKADGLRVADYDSRLLISVRRPPPALRKQLDHQHSGHKPAYVRPDGDATDVAR